MPTLDWIGKAAVINHHQQVPYRLFHCDAARSVGEAGEGNLLIEGDNLQALKALLPYYRGQVKCIYIDPPYNTGNENWVYNDNVNSPMVRKWLGETVGGETEDLSRHDKWLCMMYPRLVLLRDLLADNGAIFVSVDDTEVYHLKILMDEIFGSASWVCTLLWKRRQTPDSRNLNGISADHEYVLCYGRGLQVRFKGSAKDLSKYSNPDGDPNGPWMSDNLTGLANATERPNLHYDIVHPKTGQRYPPHPSRGWIYGQEKMRELIATNRILWPRTGKGRPRLKRYLSDMKSETTGFSTVLQAPGNVVGTKELATLLGPKTFAFPKPSDLIRTLVGQVTDRYSIILDSFAGSGTTGHAVLQQNKEDGGNRRFILVEMEPEISRNITAERLRRVIGGYGDKDGLDGGFRYCTLGEPLFDANGKIRETVKFGDLARHVFFTETGEPLPKRANGHSPLIGQANGTAYYLLWDRQNGGGVLDGAALRQLPKHDGPKVVYANGCRFSAARLKRENIVFKQIPYEIKES